MVSPEVWPSAGIICIYMYGNTYIYMETHIYVWKHIYMYGNTYVCMEIHIHVWKHIHTLQAASQFNCLEMVGPEVRPSAGITCYFHDPTQVHNLDFQTF